MKNVTPNFLISDKNSKPKLSSIRAILDYSRSYKCLKTERLGTLGVLLN